jgi:hypothetical protein
VRNALQQVFEKVLRGPCAAESLGFLPMPSLVLLNQNPGMGVGPGIFYFTQTQLVILMQNKQGGGER